MKWPVWFRVVIFALGAVTFLLSSAQAGEGIKIAAIFSYTGTAVKANKSSIDGVRFAVEEINAAGGVLGKPLELMEIDNQSSPIGSKIAAGKAVEASVVAIVGAAWSSHTLQIAKVAQANGIPLISNVSTHPDITGIGDYIFRVCFNDLYQGWAMARFARMDRNLERAVVLVDAVSDYSIGLAEAFSVTFEHLGGTIIKKLHYKRDRLNYGDLLAEVAQLEPDALFIPGHDDSALMLVEAQRIGLPATLLGADGWDVEGFYARGGNEVKHGFFSTHWSKEIDNDASRAFVGKYKKRDQPIFSPEALGYDAVYLLADALRRAGRPDRAALRNALAQTTVFHGVTGDMTFDGNGDPIKNVVIMELREGVPRYLQHVQPHSGVIDLLRPSSDEPSPRQDVNKQME